MSQEALIQELQGSNFHDISRGTDALFNFLCSTQGKENSFEILDLPELANTKFVQLYRTLNESGRTKQAVVLRRWLYRANRMPAAAVFIRLFNENAFHSERIMQAFLRDENDLFPYLNIMLISLIALRMGRIDDVNEAILSNELPKWKALLEDFVKDETMASYIEGLPLPLRYYGGRTNTILKFYDGYISRLIGKFNCQAEFLGDMGGGYATADINRATGLSFTSLDIQSPDLRQGDAENLILRKQLNPWAQILLTRDEREEYIEQQSKIPWREWNLLADRSLAQMLGNFQSYGFFSCGFLTSSVRPYQNSSQISDAHFNKTSKNACRQIMELAALGKDVSLIAIERATSVMRRHKAVVLRWQDRRLVALETLQNPGREVFNSYYWKAPDRSK